jgi:hypothetical protein
MAKNLSGMISQCLSSEDPFDPDIAGIGVSHVAIPS